MTQGLYDVRPVPGIDGITALPPDEKQRARAARFTESGDRIADRGRTRFPAYSPAERQQIVHIGRMLGAHRGVSVIVEAEDGCAPRPSLTRHGRSASTDANHTAVGTLAAPAPAAPAASAPAASGPTASGAAISSGSCPAPPG